MWATGEAGGRLFEPTISEAPKEIKSRGTLQYSDGPLYVNSQTIRPSSLCNPSSQLPCPRKTKRLQHLTTSTTHPIPTGMIPPLTHPVKPFLVRAPKGTVRHLLLRRRSSRISSVSEELRLETPSLSRENRASEAPIASFCMSPHTLEKRRSPEPRSPTPSRNSLPNRPRDRCVKHSCVLGVLVLGVGGNGLACFVEGGVRLLRPPVHGAPLPPGHRESSSAHARLPSLIHNPCIPWDSHSPLSVCATHEGREHAHGAGSTR